MAQQIFWKNPSHRNGNYERDLLKYYCMKNLTHLYAWLQVHLYKSFFSALGFGGGVEERRNWWCASLVLNDMNKENNLTCVGH